MSHSLRLVGNALVRLVGGGLGFVGYYGMGLICLCLAGSVIIIYSLPNGPAFLVCAIGFAGGIIAQYWRMSADKMEDKTLEEVEKEV